MIQSNRLVGYAFRKERDMKKLFKIAYFGIGKVARDTANSICNVIIFNRPELKPIVKYTADKGWAVEVNEPFFKREHD